MTDTMTDKKRPIWKISHDITQSWSNINPAAKPYILAMNKLETIDQKYGCDGADEIILRFLTNATTFRGEDARRLKQELKSLLESK